jgi:hypothetical protein
VGRYRANFRFTGCACNPSWFYETWTVHISNGSVEADLFIQSKADHDVDHRVHLYGSVALSAGRDRHQEVCDARARQIRMAGVTTTEASSSDVDTASGGGRRRARPGGY